MSEELNPLERDCAEALQGLQLAPLHTSAHWIWYQAGLHTGRRRANAWCAIAATTTLVAALIFVWGRQTPGPVERLVYVQQEPAPVAVVAAPAEPVSATSLSVEYLRLCDETIHEGLEGLSRERAGGGRGHFVPRSYRQGSDGDFILPDGGNILNKEDGI
jgi:hypothetical protein